MNLKFCVQYFPLKLRKSGEKIGSGRHQEMGHFDHAVGDLAIEYAITDFAVPDLLPVDHWDVQWLDAFGCNQPEINGRGSLQFQFQKLVSNVWELSVVLVGAVTERFASQSVESRPPIAFLIRPGVWEAFAHQR